MYYNNQQQSDDSLYQQKFLEHAAFSIHYERQKMINAQNASEYYRLAELEYYHKSRAMYYKGFFSAESTITDQHD